MIQFPRRSVTRFFIPLIDVLILLFCIFLLMPWVQPTGQGQNLESLQEQLKRYERELAQAREKGQAPADLVNRVEELRKQVQQMQQDSVAVRILEIEGGLKDKDPVLYRPDPERRDIASAEDAADVVKQDRESMRRRNDARKLHYVIVVLPPAPDAKHFLAVGELEKFRDEWFGPQGVGVSFVLPGAGLSVVGPGEKP